MASKQNQLTVTGINKQHSEEFKSVKRVHLNNGDYIDIQTRFKKTSIQKLIMDYQEILDQLHKSKVDADVAKPITFVYYILLLKHFTSLNNIPIDIEKMILICEKLIDLELLEEIFAHFPQEQLAKVAQMIEQAARNSKLIGAQIGELLIQNDLKTGVELL